VPASVNTALDGPALADYTVVEHPTQVPLLVWPALEEPNKKKSQLMTRNKS
jgi:hypothetical protein